MATLLAPFSLLATFVLIMLGVMGVREFQSVCTEMCLFSDSLTALSVGLAALAVGTLNLLHSLGQFLSLFTYSSHGDFGLAPSGVVCATGHRAAHINRYDGYSPCASCACATSTHDSSSSVSSIVKAATAHTISAGLASPKTPEVPDNKR
jgi:hypothetical protein